MIMDAKKWYKSKIIWVNGLALVASVLQLKYGLVMSPELQGVLLTAINIVLRAVTKEEIVW
jgi:hypothetical protein